MQNNQSRKLAHGAMMIAIFAVLMESYLCTCGEYSCRIIAPLPIIWYSVNYERKSRF